MLWYAQMLLPIPHTQTGLFTQKSQNPKRKKMIIVAEEEPVAENANANAKNNLQHHPTKE